MEKIEKRTDYCGNITEKYIGQDVNLYGWVQRVRNLGNLVFIDLRDREGLVQIVVNKDSGKKLMDIADSLGNEYVVQVKGKVVKRSEVNPDMKTGQVEVDATEIIILNKAKNPPFEIKDGIEVSEQTRLKYRYLDLRRPEVQQAIILRSKILRATHEFFDEMVLLILKLQSQVSHHLKVHVTTQYHQESIQVVSTLCHNHHNCSSSF